MPSLDDRWAETRKNSGKNKTNSLTLISRLHSHSTFDEIRFGGISVIRGSVIVFCWVPGHVGITGNEVADKAAKTGLNEEVTAVWFTATEQLISSAASRSFVLKNDKNIGTLTCINNKLYETTLTLGLSRYSSVLSRNDSVIVNRLRNAHTALTHSVTHPLSTRECASYCQVYSA